MKSVFVIDPGMMEAGGHHAALLETLIETRQNDVNLSVFGHIELDKELYAKSIDSGIVVYRHFKTNFYQHYEDSFYLKLSGIQTYIRLLAWEYSQALSYVAQQNESMDSIVCFYPCVNWEHASALSLALGSITNSPLLHHKVCCMFQPLKSSKEMDLYYKSAFRQLRKNSEVKLYASDWETKIYYDSLDLYIDDFHPCYLLPWHKLNVTKRQKPCTPNILAYFGDAKVNKGFCKLPELVERLLLAYERKIRITIQFTMAWENPALETAIRELKSLARVYEEVILESRFWSASEMVQKLNDTTHIICTYEVNDYQHKSSGLAWLARFFSIPVVIGGECWLTREFDRIGVNYAVSSELNDRTPSSIKNEREVKYKDALFDNINHWLVV